MAKAKKPESEDVSDAVDQSADDRESTVDQPVSTETEPSDGKVKTPEDNDVAETTGGKGPWTADDEVKEDQPATETPAMDVTEDEVTNASEETSKASVTDAPSDDEPSQHPMPVPVAHQERRSIAPPLIFGGIVAAALGFFAGRADVLDPYLPAALQRPTTDLSGLEQQTAAQEDRLSALEQSVAEAANTVAPESDTAADDLSVTIAALDEAIAGLTARLDDLETRPAASGSATPDPAMQEDLARLQASVQEQRDEITALLNSARTVEDNAAQMAQQTLARAALTRVISAVDNGKPFGPALNDLEQSGVVEVPQDLRNAAESGVPTLQSLQERFPDAARDALSAARDAGADNGGSGFASFLKQQLGARSVTPREGTDPDAVLSRAEPAVRDGRLTDALAELETLPEPAQTAMADWLDDARARLAAQNAAETLAQSLTTN